MLADVTGDKCDSRLHFRHDPLGFIDPIETALAELGVLGDGAHGFDLRTDICGDQLAVAPHAALQVDEGIGLANGLEAVFDLRAVLG